MLICCSECPGVFVTVSIINGYKDGNLPFISFHHYENIISCYLHKQLFPDHGKTCPSCMNREDVAK